MLTMFRVALLAVALFVAGALPAAAQQAAPAPMPAPQHAPFTVTADQLGAIAIGAVAGAVLIDVLGGGGLANLTGAVVGGYLGYWIYTQPAPVRVAQAK